jgi:multidrug efflux pump subunit AcrA (membrane-fusion protein)
MKKIVIFIIALIIIGVSVYLAWGRGGEEKQYVTAEAERRKLIQTVNETGTVRSPKKISLSFSAGGKLATKTVEVGDMIKKGEVLAELEHGSLLKEKQKALSDLEVAKAELERVLAGPTGETIEVSRSRIKQAEENYQSALEELEKTEREAEEDIRQAKDNLKDLTDKESGDKTSYEQAVEEARLNLENVKKEHERNIANAKESSLVLINSKLPVANSALDNVDKILNDSDIQSVFSAKSSKIERYVENNYKDSLKLKETAVSAWEEAKKDSSKDNISDALFKNIEYLNRVSDTLDYCYQALEKTVTSADFTQTELDAYKSEVDNRTASVNTAIDALESSKRSLNDAYLSYETALSSAESGLEQAETNLEEAVRNAENALTMTRLRGEQKIASLESKVKNAKESLEVIKNEKEEVESGASREEINLAYAKVKQAEASAAIVEERINDYFVASPVNGKVVGFEPEVGEQVQAGSPVVSVLGRNDYEVEVDISEVDIDKVKKGDVADITLDAFGEEERFKGQVFFIDPDRTVIQGVVYYEVKIKLVEVDKKRLERMKPGMTANISITTEEKQDALVIPGRAVIEKENGQGGIRKYVRVLKADGDMEEKRVEIGLRGDGGMVEVLSGVEEGEEVITYVKE